MKLVPVLLSLAILAMARWYAFSASSLTTAVLTRAHFSSISIHWWRLTATWVPKGLVSTNTSPSMALSGLVKTKILLETLNGKTLLNHNVSRCLHWCTQLHPNSALSLHLDLHNYRKEMTIRYVLILYDTLVCNAENSLKSFSVLSH